MNDRRGMEFVEAIVIVILFGIVMIVLILLYKYAMAVSLEQFTKDECQASLLLTRAADARLKTTCVAPVPNGIPLHCTRRFATVTPQGVSDVKEKLDYTPACPQGMGGNCLGQSVMAEEMATCWDLFFRGEQPVFQQAEVNSLKLWKIKDSKTACFVCSEVTLHTQQDVTDFKKYIKSTRWQKNSTYYDLFSSRKAWCSNDFTDDAGMDSCWEGYGKKQGIEQDTFKTGQKYAIVFIRNGLATCDERESETVITEQDLTMTVQAIPADKVGTFCDEVIT